MPEYTCVDGPLAGQVLEWREPLADGQTTTLVLVDVGQDDPGPEGEPQADYRVERAPDDPVPGRLRFVAARGWRTAAPETAAPEAAAPR